MIEIYGQITSDKNFKLNKKNFGNKMDNSIAKVILNEITEEGDLLNKYVAFYSPIDEIFLFPLNSEDNSFIITTTITQYPGNWRILYLSTNKEIKEGNIDTNYKVFISNSTDFTITDNFLDDTIEEVIVDENLEIVYESLQQTIVYLNSDDFKEDLINNLHISESDIETITNNIKNDEAFKEELRGEPGPAGPQGEPGTVVFEELTEEQIETLRGEPGADGVDGVGISNIKFLETDENGNNIYTITLTDKSSYEFIANKGNKGDKGDPGKNGSFEDLTAAQKEELKGNPGDKGDTGIGISNIEFKETDENGNNIYIITLTDNSTYEFIANRGEKGDTGAAGKDGSFEDLTDEEKESLKGDPGERGEDGKSAYSAYLEQFNLKPLVIEELAGGKTLKIMNDRGEEWEGRLFFGDSDYFKFVINSNERYIQSKYGLYGFDGEKIYFDNNGEVIIPEVETYTYQGQIYKLDIPHFISISLTDEVAADLFSFKNAGEAKTESAWIDSLKGKTGDQGETGATFTPEVYESGMLNWTNDKGLENPPGVYIKGPKGDKGQLLLDLQQRLQGVFFLVS